MTHGSNQDRRSFVLSAGAAIIGSEFAMPGVKSLLRQIGTASDGGLSPLRHATTWLNSPRLTPEGLRGKVVLVEFWTYTCINWLRQLPYVRAWAEKYRGHGLVVIGVHTPEFGFESDPDNVRRAVSALRVAYPVAIDNDYAIWRGFENHYWPALYLSDAQGVIRHRQFGEGAYDKTETVIQQLLAKAGAVGIGRDVVTVDGRGVEAAADWDSLRSPENYLGADRTERFVSNRDAARLRLNEWTLAGNWTLGKQAARLNAPQGRIVTRFHARDLHLVMGPAAREAAVRFRVLIDGQPPSAAHGGDVDDLGNGSLTEQRLYQLIRQPHPIADRVCEIAFLDAGAEVFAFTFG